MATKPPMQKQTPNDRVSTITHLADTIKENGKHAVVHAKEAARQAKKTGDVSLQHNAEHALNHVIEMAQHADKLIKHLGKYPGGAATLKELNAPTPSKSPAPPGKSVKP